MRQTQRRIDLAEIVRAVALDLAPLVADKNLVFDIETTPAPMACHEWMLGELTRNLLHNAIKNTPPGGNLSVRVHADTHHAALCVSDSGPGISAELSARLFQPFATGRSSPLIAHGSGLGLAICREITQALGGTIALDNRLAKEGTHVVGLDATARLPLAPQDPPAPEALHAHPATTRLHNGHFNNQAPH